jgi:hypothetical protein
MLTRVEIFELFACILLALTSATCYADLEEIYAGDLVNRIIDGEDLEGREIVLSGIVFTETSRERLSKIGAVEAFKSDDESSVVLIYDSNAIFEKSMIVRLNVIIDSAYAYLTQGKEAAFIEATYVSCDQCRDFWEPE